MSSVVAHPKCRCKHTWSEHDAGKLGCLRCKCRAFIPIRREDNAAISNIAGYWLTRLGIAIDSLPSSARMWFPGEPLQLCPNNPADCRLCGRPILRGELCNQCRRVTR